MRTVSLLLTILSWNSCFSQSQFPGLYSRQDSKIWLNSDSTFRFNYSVDTYRGWTKGLWRVKGKKISLKPIPVYDTFTLVDKNSKVRDSLILSKDEVSSRINIIGNRTFSVFQVEQSLELCPTTLFYKKRKLIVVKNGKRQKKKIKNGYYIEAFNPWYTKTKPAD